ncbi:MAG: hypothetical protein HYX65_00890 [Gemmatimonadetes bacterium]|nr:hypothetical protein [Gemmatimonadota bacterium]
MSGRGALAGLAAAFVAAACADSFAEHVPLGPDARITGAHFERSGQEPCAPCNLIVQLGVAEVRVTGGAGIAFVSDDSTSVLYTAVGGAGGFKGLGESLMRWDAATGRSVRLASEYYVIEQVSPFAPDSGRPLVIVSMREFGSGVRHLGIVDPLRGEVFRLERAAVTAIDSAHVEITEWGMAASWNIEALSADNGLPMAPPSRRIRFPLDSLRTMPVLTNRFMVWDPDAQDAAPYLPSVIDARGAGDTSSFQLGPPPRMPALGSGTVKRIRPGADSPAKRDSTPPPSP